MGDITVTATHVGRTDAMHDVVKTYPAAVTITAGQATYLASSGELGLASAAAAATAQVRGIAVNGGLAGQAITVLEEGDIEGFTLSAMNYDAILYLSNTDGALATSAGVVTVRVGRVSLVNDASKTKVARIHAKVSEAWS